MARRFKQNIPSTLDLTAYCDIFFPLARDNNKR